MKLLFSLGVVLFSFPLDYSFGGLSRDTQLALEYDETFASGKMQSSSWSPRQSSLGTQGCESDTSSPLSAVALASDGKIYQAGSRFQLYRLLANNSLDTSFGSAGTHCRSLRLSLNTADMVRGLVVGKDQKPVMVGRALLGDHFQWGIQRVDSTGLLDTSFNTTGVTWITFGPYSSMPWDLELDTSGKYLVAGYSYEQPGIGFAIARLNSNGTLDTSFATIGKFRNLLGQMSAHAFAVEPTTSGALLVSGHGEPFNDNASILLARLSSNGSLDTSFSTTGYRFLQNSDTAKRATSTREVGLGRILLGGVDQWSDSTTNWGFIARLISNGEWDTSFYTTGYRRPIPNSNPWVEVFTDTDGGNYLVGTYLQRLFSNGTTDNAFYAGLEFATNSSRSRAIYDSITDTIWLGGISTATQLAVNVYSRNALLFIYYLGETYFKADAATNPSQYDFQYARFNVQSRTGTLQVYNIGSNTAAISTVARGIASPFSFNSSGCNTLDAGSTCNVDLTFSPTSQGFFENLVYLDYNNGSSNVSTFRTLIGRGSSLSFATSAHDFPVWCEQILQTFVLTNHSGSPITGLSVLGYDDYPELTIFEGSMNDCNTTLPAGDSCNVRAVYNPPMTSMGTINGGLRVVADGNEGAWLKLTTVDSSLGDCDGDGDNYNTDALGGSDCDDGDPFVNPGMTETCANSVDDDCNGQVDEGACGLDQDGDTFSPNSGDCNDGDININPIAAEICNNGIDDNCNGDTDSGELNSDCTDDDFDGYTEADGDCDDANPSVYPGDGC